MGSVHEKNQGPKISCYCTFKIEQNARYPISPNEYQTSEFIFDPALVFVGQCLLRWMNTVVVLCNDTVSLRYLIHLLGFHTANAQYDSPIIG
jgi:hypothetical protein